MRRCSCLNVNGKRVLGAGVCGDVSWLMLLRVLAGKGYDKQLKEILDAEILPVVDEFNNQLNNGN